MSGILVPSFRLASSGRPTKSAACHIVKSSFGTAEAQGEVHAQLKMFEDRIARIASVITVYISIDFA